MTGKIKQATFEFSTAADISNAQQALDSAYNTAPTMYTRMGLQLIVQPYAPNDDLSSLLPLLTPAPSTSSGTGTGSNSTANTSSTTSKSGS